MLDKILKFLSDVPDRIWAILIVVIGGGVAIARGDHSYQIGSSLIAAGLTMHQSQPKP
jgi:hypothetical protein